mgnify:CR=1 FL=1
MGENKIYKGLGKEELLQLGCDAGRTVVLVLEGFMQGIVAGRMELAHDEEDEEPILKTDSQDCRRCWCDTCGRLEECGKHRDGIKIDGLRPLPCIGCLNGLRFRPVEKKPCIDYWPIDRETNG